MTSGNLVMNGLGDHDLVIILEVKQRHEGKLNFNPQSMQPTQQAGRAGQLYNNVTLTWQDEVGLEAVKEILHKLTSREKTAQQP